jgi:hypothetical protein
MPSARFKASSRRFAASCAGNSSASSLATGMAETILPYFDKYPEEGKYIGRILAGYGELEYDLFEMLAAVLRDRHIALKTLFRTRGEEQRIQIADALMRDAFARISIEGAYTEAIADMGWCRTVRNQYAHCHWHDGGPHGLCFVDLEETAKKSALGPHRLYPVDTTLLAEQETYFKFVQKCFWHLTYRYEHWGEKYPTPGYELPKKLPRPKRHNDEA